MINCISERCEQKVVIVMFHLTDLIKFKQMKSLSNCRGKDKS
jgi:hypothetical protein